MNLLLLKEIFLVKSFQCIVREITEIISSQINEGIPQRNHDLIAFLLLWNTKFWLGDKFPRA